MGLARGHASSRRIVGLRGSCTKNPRTEPGSHLLKPHAFLTRVLLCHNQSFLEQGAGWLCRKCKPRGSVNFRASKAAWEALKAKTVPDNLAAAYKAAPICLEIIGTMARTSI
jgi:hypothetical protein